MFGIDDAIIGAVAGGFISNAFAGERQNDAQAFAGQQSGQAQAFNSAEAAKNREWQEHMSGTAYQRSVTDLARANLNPMLAYMHGGASTPAGATASGAPGTAGIASPGGEFNIPAAMQTASNIRVQDEQATLIKAQADRTKAEEDEIRARTPTHAVSIDVMKQNINESIERVKKVIQETATSHASAANIMQQTINLKETIPQIRETVNNLKQLTNLHAAQIGLTYAQGSEIQQRVKEGLPTLEAALKRLEQQAKQYEMPRRAMESEVNADFIGAMGAVLRTLNPLSGLINSTR